MADTVIWHGASGTAYTYTVYSSGTEWNDVAGNYIFAGVSNGVWKAAYIGQTNSFKTRMANHPEWACAAKNGATHVHAHVNTDENARKAEEADLISAHRPPCNQQLR